jgi:sugar lactone lactonase YvrE
MKNTNLPVLTSLAALLFTGVASAQPAPAAGGAPAAPRPFAAGQPLGATNEAGQAKTMSSNVKVYGSFHFAESCTFDPDRNVIIAMNAANPRTPAQPGSPPSLEPNDGFASLINPDGSVHTSKWIGATRDGLTLVHPLGSAVQGGTLYVNDGNTIRTFDLKTGAPKQAFEVREATNLNGIGVARDGTMYASNTGNAQQPENRQRIYKVTAGGQASVFVDGDPLALPNGVAIDPQGNIVVVNIGNNNVLTFDTAGKLVKTEQAKEGGNDGVVILPNGTKYVSSVRFGSVSRIEPGKAAEVIAEGIPAAASMCYDSRQNQLVIPMNPNNSLAFIPLGRR